MTAAEPPKQDTMTLLGEEPSQNEPRSPYADLFGGREDQIEPKIDNFTSGKRRLATYNWKPPSDKPCSGMMVLVHGFGEHLGRYNHVASFFANLGFEVCGIDLLCHGQSQGFKGSYGYVTSMDDLVKCFTDFVRAKVVPKAGPHFVYAHSTGALVAFLAMDHGLFAKWDKLKAVVYSAPLLRQPSSAGKTLYACPGLASCLLSCGLACGTCLTLPGVRAGQLSTYKAAEDATRKDPLYFGWRANLSIVRALLSGTVEAQQKLDSPRYPFLVLVSPTDQLVDPAVAKLLFEKAAAAIKGFESEPFVGLEHELHNEEDWQKPLKIASEWLKTIP
mmetsp:Transcript_67632/g.197950  ORF Transcript_67632/g.197950 Transcript_67632/m.197950 type:complete len:332 (+) Transcript_67632:94-1089(+)